MKCKFKCKCIECENLMHDESLVYIKQKFLTEDRKIIPAYKCRFYGKYLSKKENLEKLKTSKIYDDFIYTEE